MLCQYGRGDNSVRPLVSRSAEPQERIPSWSLNSTGQPASTSVEKSPFLCLITTNDPMMTLKRCHSLAIVGFLAFGLHFLPTCKLLGPLRTDADPTSLPAKALDSGGQRGSSSNSCTGSPSPRNLG